MLKPASSSPALAQMEQQDRRIATPVLVLLLGSTAGLVGKEYITHLCTLEQSDQQRVACVFIDTDVIPRGEGEGGTSVHTFKLRIAVPAGIDSVQKTAHDQHTFIEGRVPQYYANGAGGVRNNAHVALAFNEREVVEACEQALLALVEATDRQGGVHEVQVNLVSFLGGGTGSGILADMAVLVRGLLVKRGLSHRLNIVGLLPESVYGSSSNDLQWRKSNATACLLEVIALGKAAAANQGETYQKFMRQSCHSIACVPLAHEIFLTGDLNLNSAHETARVVALDLFMRTTDGSGVGAEEHRRWVDRRTLGGTDDRGLPTIFGTSWPYEVRFPVEDMAQAYVVRSVKRLLAQQAGCPLPQEQPPTDEEKRKWRKHWTAYARFDYSEDPFSIALLNFSREQFEQADTFHFDTLWQRIEQAKGSVVGRLQAVCNLIVQCEVARIEGREGRHTPVESGESRKGQRFSRLLQLRSLKREYEAMIDSLQALPPVHVPGRPRDLESEVIEQGRRPAFVQWVTGDKAGAVCEAYNHSFRTWAQATRLRYLFDVLQYVLQVTKIQLERSEVWVRLVGSPETQREIAMLHEPQNTWMGKLESPHRHQRHLFDLPSLCLSGGGNYAVDALYSWASGDEDRFAEQVDRCIAQLSLPPQQSSDYGQWQGQEIQLTPRQCLRAIQAFFYQEYCQLFRQMNLLDLLNRAVPPMRSGEENRAAYLASFLTAHLAHIHTQMRSPLNFEPQLWDGGLSALETTTYVGVHWRDAAQSQMVRDALNAAEYLPYRGQSALLTRSQDPHRLQVLNGQHGISLSTVGEFSRLGRGAMEAYIAYQRQWEESKGTGLMPVHSSGEMQRLVLSPQTLGLDRALPACVIRPLREAE